MRPAVPSRRARGFTLVELLLALMLLSILVVALVRLLDTSLNIWGRTEADRDLLEMGSSVVELCAADLAALEPGPRGDLLVEWAPFDLDGDGVQGALYPRLRFVRRASAAELARLGGGAVSDPRSTGLVEVCWALLPAGGKDAAQRSVGILWRGERDPSDAATLSFFDADFFSRTEKPVPGALDEVTGGVLWLDVRLATQTSVLEKGWTLGDQLADCASSWDAWDRGRPNADASPLNRPAAGMPVAGDAPVLPRRVRVELELERPSDLTLRTRLAAAIDPEGKELLVENESHLPDVGALLLVDEEWMRILSKNGTRLGVERGQRGTRPARHQAGARVHHGWRLVREIPVPVHREDWKL